MKKINSQAGFTLIELMIVIAIIGILSAIAIPNFITYREQGYNAQAKTDAKEFYRACVSAAIHSTSDVEFDSTDLPDGFTGNPPKSGSFRFDAVNMTISCDAEFYHESGSAIYQLSDNGSMSETKKS